VSCQIADAATECQDGDVAPVTAGDRWGYELVPSGTPASASVDPSVLFAPTTADHFVLSATAKTMNNGDTFGFPFGDVVNDQNLPYLTIPTAGAISRLFVWCDTATAGGASRAFTARILTTPQSLTATLNAGESTKNDTSNSFAVAALDRVLLHIDATSSPGTQNCAWAMTFDPTTTGLFPIGMAASSNQTPTTGTKFAALMGFPDSRVTTTNTEVTKQAAQAMTVKKIAVTLFSATGASSTVDYTLNQNGSNVGLTCSMANPATSCAASTDISVADDDLLSTDMTVTVGSPGPRPCSISYAATIP
jgi:hypothetical protein